MIHEEFGSVTLNLNQAIRPAQIPSTATHDDGKITLNIVSDSHNLTVMHGYLMVAGFIILSGTINPFL